MPTRQHTTFACLVLIFFSLGCGNNDTPTPTTRPDASQDQSPDQREDTSQDQEADTQTDQAPFLCMENQRVEGITCAPCPNGMTNEAGDDPMGPDTSCDPILCPQDQRVQDNLCAPCEPGSDNAPGDDASALNTSCDPILCGQDERVQDNACVPCEQGTINENGDDSSGPNTQCDVNDECSVLFGVSCTGFAQAYIKASNTGAGDQFGFSVALRADTLIVGAPLEASDATGIDGDQEDSSFTGRRSGAVYVFVRDSTNTWTQQAYIKASNTGRNDRFGSSVALDGNTLVVGAPSESSDATGVNGNPQDATSHQSSGAVYVFVRDSTNTWTQQAYVKASNTGKEDFFGDSVAINGDTIAVGATREKSRASGINGDQTDDSNQPSGAVYVFIRTGTLWAQQAYIKAPANTGEFETFGRALSLHQDTLVVSDSSDDSKATGINGDETDNSAQASGAVHVFQRLNDTWTQEAYIKASNTGEFDVFGSSIMLHGNTLAVGAYQENSDAMGIGGDQSNDAAFQSGAVYIFVRDNANTWTQQAYIKASNTDGGDKFGYTLALHEDTLAVGALRESSDAVGIGGDQSSNATRASGAVYTFARTGTTWTQQAYIKAPNPNKDAYFSVVALHQGTLAIGSYGEASNATGINGDQMDTSLRNSGAVYIRKIKP